MWVLCLTVFARAILCCSAYFGKEELRFFELVLVQRSWDFFNWFSSNHYEYLLSRDFFSWFSSNSWRVFLIGLSTNDDIRALPLGGMLSPNIPGLASYLTSFSVPTGRDDGLPNLLCSTPSCATSRFGLEATLRAG